MGRIVIGLCVALVACVKPELTSCPTVDCPADMVCDGVGGCVMPEQLTRCAQQAAGAACEYTNRANMVIEGACSEGVCRPIGCGNGLVTPNEVCDDGNTVNGDGCSADCLSNETCGNLSVDPATGEQCDDGNTVSGDGCQAGCKLPRCGDGTTDALLAEQCDAGEENSLAPDAACRPNCQPPRCGDGIRDVNALEACDDGNNQSADGCSGDCRSDERCGNGVVDALVGEVCDDGNTFSNDGCSSDCRSREVCGDGVVNVDEVCDDSNTSSGDGCSADCQSLETCGNGILDVAKTEQCDAGANNSNLPDAPCRPGCLAPRCGDGVQDPGRGEGCDLGMMNSDAPNAACRVGCQLPRCGDGIVDSTFEACDDGNLASGDGCSADCQSLETCGNGVVDIAKGEQCDLGMMNSDSPNALCRTDCQPPRCGDGVQDTSRGESCDLGPMNSDDPNSTCRTSCQVARCGDHIVDTSVEACDDGNLAAGDGCSADCRSLETCGNGIVDVASSEQCDDGENNSLAPDATCRPGCLAPRCGDGVQDPGRGEGCDLGMMNSDAPNAACRVGCQLPRCGDGIVDSNFEACDDGDLSSGDGCSADCQSLETCGNGIVDIAKGEQCDLGPMNADSPNALCRTDCQPPRCGDGVQDTSRGESCDLGPMNSDAPNSTCRTSCQLARCGDGVQDTNFEACDDGNLTAGDGCSADCQSLEVCGNGVVDVVKAEQCDAGALNANTPDAPCRTDCKAPRCGDGVRDLTLGEGCDQGPLNSNAANATCRTNCQLARCGDGIRDTNVEVCDDGNATAGDGCSADCQSLETCGNGIVDVVKGEQCDAGANNSNLPDAPCRTGCKLPRCGDAVVDTALGETCDQGTSNSYAANAACRPNCQPRRCGDGIKDTSFEVCDDTNTAAGDGCSPDCQSDETCGNGVIDYVKGEQCDDRNGRARDGCSVCRPESAIVLQPNQTPAARDSHVIVYDAARRKVVMYGGWTAAGNLADTWEWDGTSWTQIVTARSPGPRLDAAYAYDAKRRRVVVFGGYAANYTGIRGDTWEYDGVDWVLRSPATSPPPTAAATATYDATRGTVLLYGGLSNEDPTQETATWEWNGETWTKLSPAANPGPRSGHRMVYDAANKYVLLFGGGLEASTWTWNGVTWTDRGTSNVTKFGYDENALAFDATRQKVVMWDGTPGVTYEWRSQNNSWQASNGATPTERSYISSVYDAANKQIVLFGGYDATGNDIADTWLRTGTSWAEAPPFVEPGNRASAAVGYDPVRRRVVVFSGRTDIYPPTNDTWEWNGQRWTSVAATTPPVARSGGKLAYNTSTRRLMLFGGQDQVNYTDLVDLYAYNGVAWSAVTPSTGRTTVKNSSMAWDSTNNRLIDFGGRDTANTYMSVDTTWHWTSTVGWVAQSPAQSPPARKGHGLAYDPVRQRTVLFGGHDDDTSPVSGVWEYDGATWRSIATSSGPPARAGLSVVYNPDARRVMAFGNSGSFSGEELWDWDGTAWAQRQVVGTVLARYRAAIAYDAANHALVAFGGRDASFVNDGAGSTRLIAFWPNITVEACTSSQIDYDRDGLAGCADDDCWAVCTPLCPPGTTCPTTAPRCGDGTCTANEDCYLCPADCGACTGGTCGNFHCDSGETTTSCPIDCIP